MSQPRWMKPVVTLLVILGGLLPVFLYWWLLGRVPTLTAENAIKLLNRAGENAVLVDVRDATAFAGRHLQVAQSWPLEDIATVASLYQVPAQFRDKTLLLICEIGISSTDATRRLQALGLDDVYNVRGGIQAWVAAWAEPCASPLCKLESSSGEIEDLSFRVMAQYEQWAEVIAYFVLKPTYMTLSVILALILIVTHRRAPDMVALRWALIFFFMGESFCVMHSWNYLVLRQESYLFEYLHGYGMVLAFGFTTYALIEGLDTRGFKLSSPGKRCAALELCGPCIKYEDAPCGARRLFLLLIPLLIILAAIPLFAMPSNVSYNTHIIGVFYNFAHLAIYQIFEIRYCPVLAIILFGLSFIVLWVKTDRPAPTISKVLFSAGLGTFGFSMFRLLLSAIYRDNLVWFDFWEELTELLYMVAVGCVLWIFRRGLFQEDVQSTRLVT